MADVDVRPRNPWSVFWKTLARELTLAVHHIIIKKQLERKQIS